MANVFSYKGYKGSINKEEGYYWGEILGLKDSILTYESKNLEDLEKEFIACVEEYYDLCKEIDIEPEIPDYEI